LRNTKQGARPKLITFSFFLFTFDDMKITFIQTGGTIDKDYPQTTKGWAFEFGNLPQ
jgi:hypothetical protein